MSITFTSPLAYPAGFVGFTSPTATLTSDKAPDLRSSQVMVSALGGTQTGVRIHRPSDPFTLTLKNPAKYAVAPVVDANGNVVGTVPLNVFTGLVRKGLYVVGTQVRVGYFRWEIGVPAGADSVDAPNVRAMCGLGMGSIADRAGSITEGVMNGNFA